MAALPLVLCCATPVLAQTASLPETLVTATRFADNPATLPFGVSVLTADDIRASGASSVNEAVMRLLGVVGRQDFYGGGEYALDLRGFGSTSDSNQIVVLDGVRLTEADQGGTRLSGIPIDTVERIEVLRGSGSVLYGEGASGGVIVITTRAGIGKERRNTAALSLGAGSYGLRDARATATVAGGGFSVDVSGTKREHDNHRDNFRSEAESAGVSVQWSNDAFRFGARLGYDDLYTRLPGALSAAQYAANPRQTNTPNDSATIRNDRSSLFAEAYAGDWQLGADVGWRDKVLRSSSYDYDVEATTYALRARNESTLGRVRNVFTLGTDYGRWERQVPGAFGSTARQASRAWYVNDDLTLPGAATRLSAGLRSERIEKDITTATAGLSDRQTAWELGVSQPVGPGVTVYGRLGRSFRLANVDEFSYTAPGVSLAPQASRDVELGSRFSYTGGKVELRVYRSNLTNEIGFDPNAPGPFGPGANANFDPTRRLGLELDTTHALTKAVSLRVNAAARQSTFRSGAYAGKDVPLAPSRSLALRADWQPSAQHRVTGGVNWVSSQRPDFDNLCRMPSYATADVRYAFTWQQVELALGVTNLFDSQYYTQAFSCAAGVTGGIYPEAGRVVTASVRVRF